MIRGILSDEQLKRHARDYSQHDNDSLSKAVEAISSELKGFGVGFLERQVLNYERRCVRDLLAARQKDGAS